MLERFPQTREVLNSPKNKRAKQLIETSISLNRPLLEGIMREKNASIMKYDYIICEMLGQSLEFGTRFPKNLVSISRKIALAWDSVTKEERRAAGLDEEFCTNPSSASAYFSNIGVPRNAFGLLLNHIEEQRMLIKRWRMLRDLKMGTVPFEEIQELFLSDGKRPVILHSFEVGKEGLILKGESARKNVETGEDEGSGEKIKLTFKDTINPVNTCGDELMKLKNEAAKRLIVGYSSALY